MKREVFPDELAYIHKFLTGPWDAAGYEIVPPYGIEGRAEKIYR